ncbi:TonB-dependent receptor domain-containing protein [Candidatus Foliamicus sp.]
MIKRKTFPLLTASIVLLSGYGAALAQQTGGDSADETEIEEIVVTGSHIKGANIAGALPVSVIGAEEIENTGVDSGDVLMQFIPEQGQNYFNEEENISGGVNSARGDIGAFNLRNLGTGNTLVLFNGRRVVNAASYQTEEVGGSFVPVNTANTQTIPIYGMDRLEILKDGASALYGADAVAGVVNYVVRDEIDHARVYLRQGWFDNVGRNTQRIGLEWGDSFNADRTRVGLLANWYARDRISASEDERWADSDFRRRIPEDSPWAGDTRFRNNSANSLYGQFDVRASARSTGLRNVLTDSSGEFETYPAGDPRCQWDLGYGTCGGIDSQGTYRRNLNETRDLSSDLKRGTAFLFVNHTFENGMESFSELLYYMSDTHLYRHASAPFSTVKLRVAADNYYNPFGPCDSPNRLPDSVLPSEVPCEGLELEIDNYRFAEFPRIVENDGSVIRVLQGLRGAAGKWDWESALVWSRAKKEDLTRNRVSNLLMVEALADPTPAAYNPFSGGVDSNIERALVDVYRNSETTLAMADFQVSTAELLDLPWGPAGGVAGVEFRRETFEDDRDPRLDGTIVFTDFQGDTFPYVSDVVNSSPTPDNRGSRNVASLFTELQFPLLNSIDVQLAARYENFSDVGSTVVPKVAVGWQAASSLLLRGSWSEAFRAPNLITINEVIVARQNTRTDFTCAYAAANGGDPDQDTLDCRNSTQRIAQGSKLLEPERSDNYSFGLVFQPLDTLTLTLDWWSIKKEDTIGLLGEENHTVLDLLARLQHGADNCGSLDANSAVVREAEVGDDEAAIYAAAGICPAGLIRYIDDNYVNLDTRTLNGWDASLRYALDTPAGEFRFTYLASFLTDYEQVPGGQAAELVAAKDAGTLPASIPVAGFADLLQKDGNQKIRQTLFLSWRRDPLRIGLSARYLGDFYQDSLTLDDGTRYWIPSVTTWNGTIDYRWEMTDRDWRLRLGVNNLFDKRAPLADRYFGFFADAHQGIEYGRNFYLQLRVTQPD